MKKELPILITQAQVRKILGKVPRSLENMVVYAPRGQKLYRRREVERMQHAKTR